MSITKRIDRAREAFERRDLTASSGAHSPQAIATATEEHGGASHQYIGDMVYGGLKVLITERSWFRSGLEMLAVGALAVGVACLLGYLLRGLSG